jgi:SAM-dependent methyltransferase
LPHLQGYCRELYGLDVHTRAREVTDALVASGARADLRSGNIEQACFDANFFDMVVAVSALEFIDDLPAACREIHRILCPGGRLIVVTPGNSALVDLGLCAFTGESAKRDFGNRRDAVLPTLFSQFRLEQRLHWPRLAPRPLRLYTALRLGKLDTGGPT